jgi:hypothetical protein
MESDIATQRALTANGFASTRNKSLVRMRHTKNRNELYGVFSNVGYFVM